MCGSWFNEVMTTTSARRFENPDDIDILASYPTVMVAAKNFAEDMVLLDELGTPAGRIDHKAGRASNGTVKFLVEDLNRGGWNLCSFSANRTFPVAG